VALDAIMLDNVQMAGFSLSGEIRTEKEHPVYGNYFGGKINATFGALSEGVKVGVTAVFGNNDFRYWYVEGKAEFQAGIPIGGPVSLNGFTGGVYYRMSATGKSGLQAYEPNKDCSLGVKAGVGYFIGSKTAVHGEALFEINFLSAGGIKNIHFYGSAEFMSPIDLGKFAKFEEVYKKAQAKLKDMGESLTANLPPALSGSDMSQKLLPDLNLTVGVNAYVTMDYDFLTKTFDANCKVNINTPGGFLRGAGNNNEAGWAHIYCSPQTWYVHVGTPTNPIGVKLGLGALALKSESYFMLGDKLEPALPPPTEVLNILGISSTQADYMKYPNELKLGKGIAFGSRFSFDTGTLSFLILYARFATHDGFDFMLTDMSNYACEGSSSPVGINGWYANGQCYLSLQGELGAQIKLWFVKKRIPIIKGAAAALLQARGPNPTWIGGYMGLRLNVLGGLIKGNMKMKFSFGDDCKLVRIETGDSPIDLPLIADLTPPDKDENIDVFLTPQATFNMAVGESFSIEDENGKSKSYRIQLDDFSITDNHNQKIAGKIKWSSDRKSATFESLEILPPKSNLKASVTVLLEEFANGKWSQVVYNGKKTTENKSASFETGDAPQYIPRNNIEYLYPVIDQQYFYTGESNKGYVKLKRGQTYLFTDEFTYHVAFTPQNGNPVNVPFIYNAGKQQVEYTLPKLEMSKPYSVELTLQKKTNSTMPTDAVKTSTRQVTDESGESYMLNIEEKKTQQQFKNDAVSILDYTFKTSRYETLAQKMATLTFTKGAHYISNEVRTLFLDINAGTERFGEVELLGNDYSGGSSLIVAEATLEDTYYQNEMAPMLYNWYPKYNSISITNRNTNATGVPPVRGFGIENRYFERNENVFPLTYQLPYFYNQDYYELRSKVANSYNTERDLQTLSRLMYSLFPALHPENYGTRVTYHLPNGDTGSETTINYIYW
jgi:hypothetical protein